ncbi:MAG: T9SS type A sorting domain-containing protein [Bacteroidales bacterium]
MHFISKFWCALILMLTHSFVNGQADSVFTNIPSDAAGETGIAVRIDVPEYARYTDTAPVAIMTQGGFHGEGLGKGTPGMYDYGFIEIRYNFPGCITGEYHSGGIYDIRGYNSLLALKDVIRFALDHTPDTSGNKLSDYIESFVPDKNNTGLIAYSYGGVTNINVAGVFGQDFPELAWILNWESPVGDGMPTAEAGARPSPLRPFNPLINPAYNPDNGNWNMETLNWDDSIAIPIVDNINDTVYGGLYFDFNMDNSVDPGQDFIAYPLVFDLGEGYKAYYSNRLMTKADEENLFPQNPPSHIISVSETADFWHYRNTGGWIDSLVSKLTDLLFMVNASETDHVQTAPDHPHVLFQYRAFGQANAKFLRLNPDSSYIRYVLGYHESSAKDNDAYAVFNHMTIRDCFEPGDTHDLLGRAVNVPAGACELADRTNFDVYTPQLDDVLVHIEAANNINNGFKTYPNPCHDHIFLELNDKFLNKPAHLTLFDVKGNAVQKQNITAGQTKTEIQLNGLKSGVYYLQIKHGHKPCFEEKILKIEK